MSTLRVSNIEAKADPSSPSIDEKLKVTNSNGDVLVQIDGKTVGVTTVGINTTDKSFAIDNNQNVEFLGIVTATKFSLSGGGEITGGDGNFTGIVTASSIDATSATFSGNVSIAGTLTYEDVTSIDSVGIITAQGDVHVGAGLSVVGISTLANTNINGQLTATNARITGVTTFGTSSTTINGAHEYPSIRPVLDLNFAATKTLDRRITFTRDGVGTYVDDMGIVKYASNNSSRFDHDPTTGESLGLLIEEARTNINKVSTFRVSSANRFSINSASEQTAGENTNDVIGPDGTANGVCRAFFTGSESDPSGSVYVMASTSSSNGADFTTTNTHTSSVWIRPGLETVWKITAHSNYASASAGGSATTIDFIFTLTGEGTVTSIESGGIAASVKKYPNNWYRCTITYHRNSTASVSSGYGVIIYPNVYTNYSANSQTGDIGWFWGPQVEEGAFATSYIPTSGSTVTRSKDIAVIKGTNFTDVFDTNFKEFSLLVDYDNSKTDDGTYYEIASFWGESTGFDDRISITKDDQSPYHIETRAFGAGSGIFSNGLLSASSKAATQKLATSWSVPDYSNTSSRRWAFCFSGETPIDVVNDGTGTSVPAVTRLGLGISPTRQNENEVGGLIHYKRFVAYNKALPDAQLQGLTAQ